MTNDRTIRKSLHDMLRKIHYNELNTHIVDELLVGNAKVRADVAVINGELSGYEIKSDADNLVRLENQIEGYSEVFDKMSIVTGKKHLARVKDMVPQWWEVLLAKECPSGVELEIIRTGKKNPREPIAGLLDLLWKEDLLVLQKNWNLELSRRLQKNDLIEKLIINSRDLSRLKKDAYDLLKSRKGEATQKQQTQHAGLSRSVPKKPGSQMLNLDQLLLEISHYRPN